MVQVREVRFLAHPLLPGSALTAEPYPAGLSLAATCTSAHHFHHSQGRCLWPKQPLSQVVRAKVTLSEGIPPKALKAVCVCDTARPAL